MVGCGLGGWEVGGGRGGLMKWCSGGGGGMYSTGRGECPSLQQKAASVSMTCRDDALHGESKDKAHTQLVFGAAESKEAQDISS